MLEIPKEVLSKIVQELSSGFECFIHRKTFEFVSHPNEIQMMDVDDDLWSEERARVASEKKNFYRVENISSTEMFEIMEEFANEVSDRSEKIALLTALDGKKPFRNFNHLIHHSDYREAWFAFKEERMIQFVSKQLEHILPTSDKDHSLR